MNRAPVKPQDWRKSSVTDQSQSKSARSKTKAGKASPTYHTAGQCLLKMFATFAGVVKAKAVIVFMMHANCVATRSARSCFSFSLGMVGNAMAR